MKLLDDYYYRFQDMQLHMPGRCRIRIYKRRNGAHTVLLTELETNIGESITGSCERIATDVVLRTALNPKTTRWIQHELPHHDPTFDGLPQEDLPQVFDELRFTWSTDLRASAPHWQHLSEAEAMALTGDSLSAIARQMGDRDEPSGEETEDA
jgi:hypothetical protein